MLYEIVEILYISFSAWLAIYGVNALYLTLRYWSANQAARKTSLPPPPVWPKVTIQLPLYNEKHVVGRLLESVSRIDYPRDLLEVQVLDDSTDDTVALVADLTQRLAKAGLDIQHIRRANRDGFKAGALGYGLKFAKGEFVAVFDADFVPPREFLTATIPQFQDPKIGCVQTRWGYLNSNVSSFARALSVAVDSHYIIEKNAQYQSGYFINFNGSAGVWRKSAIESAGGWQADTLTEDLDLSMRAQLAGWRFAYLPNVICPSELPFLIEGFRRQQFRWAKGSTQAAGKLLGRLWLAPLPLMVKFEASLQLTAYFVHPLMLIAAGFTAILSLSNSLLPRWLPVFSISALGLPLLLISAQAENRRPWSHKLLDVVQLILMGAGLTPTSGRAVFEAVLGINSPFLRTPKFADDAEWTKSDYSLHIDSTVWAESITMAVYFLTIAATYSKAYWGAATVLALPLVGQFYLMWISLGQTRKLRKKHEREVERVRAEAAAAAELGAETPAAAVASSELPPPTDLGAVICGGDTPDDGNPLDLARVPNKVPVEFPVDQE